MDLAIRVLSVKSGQLRCALCHDHLGGETWTCSGCDTRAHAECAPAVCPTLGCPTRDPPAPGPALGPALASAPRALAAAALAASPRGSLATVRRWRFRALCAGACLGLVMAVLPALQARGPGEVVAHLLSGAGLGIGVALLAALLDLLAWPRRDPEAPGLWSALTLVSIGAGTGFLWFVESWSRGAYCYDAWSYSPPHLDPGDYAVPVMIGGLAGAGSFLLLRAAFGLLAWIDRPPPDEPRAPG